MAVDNYVALNQLLVPVPVQDERKAPWTLTDWQPSLAHPHPPGVRGLSSAGFYILHKLHLFSSPNYCAIAIYLNGRNIHRSVIFPKDPRIGFMDQMDLQVGNIFTEPEFRRHGLAMAALQRIREKFPGRRLWFFADLHNVASLKLAEAAGFTVAGSTTVSRFMGFGYRYGALSPLPANIMDKL